MLIGGFSGSSRTQCVRGVCLTACLWMATASAARGQSGGGIDVSWNNISSAGSGYESAAVQAGESIGQVAGEIMSGGGITFVSGFLAGVAIDCNENDIDDEFDLSSGFSEDCNTNGFPDECEPSTWIGLDGASFFDSASWDPAGAPGSDVIMQNTTAADNRSIFDAGAIHDVCLLTIGASGAGRQILRIEEDAVLNANTGMDIQAGGTVELADGELTGGPITNAANTISGYGLISANLINEGLVRGSLARLLTIQGTSLDNRPGGTVLAPLGSAVAVTSPDVAQAGQLRVEANATMTFDIPLTNSDGGLITLLGGALGAPSLHNLSGGNITGTGVIQSNVTNDGFTTIIADTLVVGNLANEGTVTIQSGILTVTGSLSGSGTIIGGFGGRGGPASGIALRGNFDLSTTDWRHIDLTTAVIQMVGDPGDGLQTFEVPAIDRGAGAVSLPDASLFSIGTLRIGPTPTTVRLVDAHHNALSDRRDHSGTEALYVRHLILDPGVTLDLAGQRLYYETVTPRDPSVAGSGVTVVDSVGGGTLTPLERTRRSR